jgi:hypothetical protein
MKKILLIALAAMFTLTAYSTPKVVDYVVTNDGIEFFKKVREGYTNYIVAVKEDGTKIKYTKDEVLSFRTSGEVFIKKTYFDKSKKCEDCTFMQLFRTRHGFSIFLYTYNDSGQYLYKCLVYKGDDFVLEVDESNADQIIHFFSKKYV